MIGLLSVALGGALGALTRYGTVKWLTEPLKESFWATLAVNLTGCFVIGLLSALFFHHRPHEAWRLLFITGFLGSFTTYSTFTLDALHLLLAGNHKIALLHLSAHLIGGLLLCLLGLQLGKALTV